VFILGLGFHLGDRLHLALKDEETLVGQVDAALLEGVSNISEVAGLAVDVVLALSSPGNVPHHHILTSETKS